MIALLLATLLAAAPAQPEKLTKVVDYEPAVSPDGKSLAFVSNRDGRFKLHVMNLDGTGLRRLTDDAGADDNPAWSPDGSRIAFVSEAGGEADIFVIGADGQGRRRLTTARGPDLHPEWSPDGRRLLFSSMRDSPDLAAPDRIDVYVMDADGRGQRRLTRDRGSSYASWSPDGTGMLLRTTIEGDSEIALADVDGRIVRRLTRHPGFDGWPAFSPDGARVAFARERGDAEDQADIFVVDLRTGAERLLAGEPGRKTNPRFSTDGRHVVYSRRAEGEIRLWRVPADGPG